MYKKTHEHIIMMMEIHSVMKFYSLHIIQFKA